MIISLFWSYFYTSSNWFNDYGADKHEWWLLIDVFVTIPLVCYFCLKDDIKQTIIKSIVYMGILILLGSFIIPVEYKDFWLHLETLRYVIIVLFIIFELFIISSVVYAIRFAYRNNKDPDLAISEPLEKHFGKSIATNLMQIDLRLWSFVLFPKKIIHDHYYGDVYFYCHLKDGAQSFLQGFIFLTIFEMPMLHIVLHFIWSPMAANVITAITIFSLAYLIAQYRAIEKRPISLSNEQLIVRYALSNPVFIDFDQIIEVEYNKDIIRRKKGVRRFNIVGVPNVKILLKASDAVPFQQIYIGVNSPSQFVSQLRLCL